MDKSLEETKKMNAKSRQSKSAQPGSSYTNMNESALQQARQANANSATNQSGFSQNSYALQQARQENMKSANSATNSATNAATNFATNSVMPSSNSGMPGDPTLDEVKKANEKSRQNKGK